MKAGETLLDRFVSQPNTIAIIDTYRGQTRETSFTELNKRGQHLATMFSEYGLVAGDNMLVFCSMSAELYAILFALLRLGIVATFIHPSPGLKHIENCCALCSPKAIIAEPKAHLLRFVSSAIRNIPLKFSTGRALPGAPSIQRAERMPACSEIFPAKDETPALLTFTSGTTAEPKASMRTHGHLGAQYEALQHTMQMQAQQIDLSILPIVVLCNLVSGVTTLIPSVDLRKPSEVDAQTILKQIHEHQPQSATVSPAFIERIVDYALKTGSDFSTMTKIYCGGAPVYSKLLRKFNALSPDIEVVSIYGSTEAEPIAAISSKDQTKDTDVPMAEGKGLLVGFPVKFIELKVVQDSWGKPVGPFTQKEFEERWLPPGEVGEIVVTGEHVLKGYVTSKHDADTKFDVNAIRWHRTGDSGYLDEHGRLWLTGRCEAVIRDERGTLNPFAVENAAQLCEGVQRAALVGGNGQRILAIQPVPRGPRPDISDIKDKLAWAQIDHVKIVSRIPVDHRHNAKVSYAKLRNQFGLHADAVE